MVIYYPDTKGDKITINKTFEQDEYLHAYNSPHRPWK